MAQHALVETGWSVLVKGRAAEVTDPVELDDVTRLPLHPWAPGPKDHWIRIEANEVTGRSISRRRHDADGRLIPYMPPLTELGSDPPPRRRLIEGIRGVRVK